MRVENLIKLLDAERVKIESNPKTKASKATLKYVCYMGLSDEDMVNYAIPTILAMEKAGQCSKEEIKRAIGEHPNISLLPLPVRHAVDGSVKLRRMDSLSRLLSLDTKYTPCVAVTFYNGELIASSNTPNPKETMTDGELAECFARKMGIIQDFLNSLIKDAQVGSQPNIKKIQFSTRARLLAVEAVTKIIAEANGGVGDVVPTTPTSRHQERHHTISHLQNALLKLGQHCILGVLTNGAQGYSLEDIKTLLNPEITVVTPETSVLEGQQLHAEQAILYYLRTYTDLNNTLTTGVPIGISKLCCQACHHVLSKDDKTTHRGTHGMKFPSVYDIDTEELYQGTNTKLGADLCPEDSDSDCEDISGEKNSFDDDFEDDDVVPTLDELLETPKYEIAAKSKFMLFKACKAEEGNVKTASSVITPPTISV